MRYESILQEPRRDDKSANWEVWWWRAEDMWESPGIIAFVAEVKNGQESLYKGTMGIRISRVWDGIIPSLNYQSRNKRKKGGWGRVTQNRNANKRRMDKVARENRGIVNHLLCLSSSANADRRAGRKKRTRNSHEIWTKLPPYQYS